MRADGEGIVLRRGRAGRGWRQAAAEARSLGSSFMSYPLCWMVGLPSSRLSSGAFSGSGSMGSPSGVSWPASASAAVIRPAGTAITPIPISRIHPGENASPRGDRVDVAIAHRGQGRHAHLQACRDRAEGLGLDDMFEMVDADRRKIGPRRRR